MRKRVCLPEIWKQSPIFGDRYEVSSKGRVRNRKGVVLKHGKQKYPTLILRRAGVEKFVCIHVLVCEAFHGPKPSPDHVVNHKNGHKDDNWFENLEWVTRSENNEHAEEYLASRRKTCLFKSPQGETYESYGLAKFCRSNDLDYTAMSRVARGLSASHKGWTITYLGDNL